MDIFPWNIRGRARSKNDKVAWGNPEAVKPTTKNLSWLVLCVRNSLAGRHVPLAFRRPSYSWLVPIRLLIEFELLIKDKPQQSLKSQKPGPRIGDELCDWNKDESFSHYTSGRWVFNEGKQLARRYVKLDMNELAHIAAESVGSRSCQKVEKLAEGHFNKVFLMTTEDGKEVIAKVPQPIAGFPHFTTASEVATMDYARNILGLPVPKIYAWNSKASKSPVGAEYIIMEKAPGVELAQVWPKMLGNQRRDIVKKIVQFEKRYTNSTFPGIGSLYYADSLDESTRLVIPKEGRPARVSSSVDFVIGPTTDPRFCEEGHYLMALGLHDISYVKSGTKPPSPGIFGGPGFYQPSVTGKLATLQDYIKIARYLPPKDPSVTAAVLWHDDLHAGNIFVNPDNPTIIVCMIDWQSSHVSPLFRHSIRPEFLNFEGPKPLLGMVGDARKPPQLPSNFRNLSDKEQRAAEALVRQQSLYKMYEIYSAKENPSVSKALIHRETLRCQLIDSAVVTSYHMEPYVKTRLIEVVDAWEQIAGPEGPPCPLHYSEDERKIQAEEMAKWLDSCALLDSVLDSLGVPTGWDGAVSCEQYLETREKLQIVRKEFLNQMAKNGEERAQWAKAWPYNDDGEAPISSSIANRTAVRKAFAGFRKIRETMSPQRIMNLLTSHPSNGAGSRFWPSADPHRDAEIPIRFDRGEIKDGKQRIWAQRNAHTKDPSWTKISTHENLAYFDLDVNAVATEGDFDDFLNVMEERTILGENVPPPDVEGGEGK
ncbi:MAG: hypothetical protein Q9216_007151, partial [Gyalolechia sp. 2 TL-2023]